MKTDKVHANGGTGEQKRSPVWEFRLYVAGRTSSSVRALANLKHLCEEHLRDRYRVEVVDLVANPHLAEEDRILVTPTLVRRSPPPMRKIIGDLSNTRRTLVGLDLPAGDMRVTTPR